MNLKKIRGKVALICAILAAVELLLFFTLKPEYNEAYKYTINTIFKYSFYPLVFIALICNTLIIPFIKRSIKTPWIWGASGLAGIAFILIPVLAGPAADYSWNMNLAFSVCWIFGAFLLTFCLICIAVWMNNILSSILCLVATIFFIFGITESYLLFTYQPGDGFTNGVRQSRHVVAGKAQSIPQLIMSPQGIVPVKPVHPSGSYAHRELYFGEPAFDVHYTFDENNRRVLPPHNEKPEAEIMLFGCSFTFGFGLEDDETWPWKLATLLGPEWQIDNYAYSAFGAHQMYTYLEDGVVRAPVAPFRQAMFIALRDHMRRFTGLPALTSPWFTLENGKLARKGMIDDSPYARIFRFTGFFNGSQAARELSGWLNQAILKRNMDEFRTIYIDLILESAKILKEKFNTPLTVLIWGDIDEIGPDLEKNGIRTLYANRILKNWNVNGGREYYLYKDIDRHPNNKATTELADYLNNYFQDLYKEWQMEKNAD